MVYKLYNYITLDHIQFKKISKQDEYCGLQWAPERSKIVFVDNIVSCPGPRTVHKNVGAITNHFFGPFQFIM